MTIECVSHCFEPAQLYPQYSTLLSFQISSLIAHPPFWPTRLTVCHTTPKYDPFTNRVLDVWCDYNLPGTVSIKRMELPPELLFERAIGRNRACDELLDDTLVVWFADVDMLWEGGCLEELGLLAQRDLLDELSHLAFYYICQSHELGDAIIKAAPAPPALSIPPEDCWSYRKGRAIGGQQIVRADIARAHGYCRNAPRSLQPSDKILGFRKCRSDIRYRQVMREFVKGGWTAVDLPNCRRLRHLKDGRDFRLQMPTPEQLAHD